MDEINPPVFVPGQPRPPEELVLESIPESTPPTNPPRRLKLFLVAGGMIVFLAILIGFAVYLQKARKTPEGIACTQEAKQCPDGSYVSRTGPNCEFAPCPTPTPDPTANWKTYIDQQRTFSFKYPPDLVLRPLIQSDETESISFAFDNKEKLVLSKLPNSQNMDLREFNEKIKLTDTKIEYESILVNGYEALLMRTKWPCINECDPTQVKNGQYHVEFKGNKIVVGFKINTLDKVGSTSISDEKWLDQILSTFKFLDETDLKSETFEKDRIIMEESFASGSGEEKKIIVYKTKNIEGYDAEIYIVNKNYEIKSAQKINISSDIPTDYEFYISPAGAYILIFTRIGDNLGFNLLDSQGKIISNNFFKEAVNQAYKKYNMTGGGMWGMSFIEWRDNNVFITKLLCGCGDEFQVSIDAKTGNTLEIEKIN